VPRIEITEHSCGARNDAFGIKRVGENGAMGAIPTIIGAIEDALAPLELTLNQMPARSADLARLCASLSPRVGTGELRS
jgi:hypothetical protein